jgi:Holliday junction DNA helicase RuvA
VISSVRGKVQSVGLDHVVIEVGGVGMAVQAAPSTLAMLRRGEEAQLSTALIVREDSLTLFGFADTDARDLFWLLLTVSGIGPRLGLAMLAVLEPDKLRAALSEGNITMLTQVPGIGKKGAERLIIELRDKVGTLPVNGEAITAPSAGVVRSSVVDALVGLGFPLRSAEQTVDGVLAENSAADTAIVLRKSLAVLGRKR